MQMGWGLELRQRRVVWEEKATGEEPTGEKLVFNRSSRSFSVFWINKGGKPCYFWWGGKEEGAKNILEAEGKGNWCSAVVGGLEANREYCFKTEISGKEECLFTREIREGLGALDNLQVSGVSGEKESWIFLRTKKEGSWLGKMVGNWEIPVFSWANFFEKGEVADEFELRQFDLQGKEDEFSYVRKEGGEGWWWLVKKNEIQKNEEGGEIISFRFRLWGADGRGEKEVRVKISSDNNEEREEERMVRLDGEWARLELPGEWLKGNFRIEIGPKGYLSRNFSCEDCFLGGVFNYWLGGKSEYDLSKFLLIPGDVDGNGQVTVKDFSLIKKYIGSGEKVADIDGNGTVNGREVVLWTWGLKDKWAEI